MKDPYFKEKVKAIEVKKKKISKLLDEMADTGFQGRRLGEVVKVWEKMIKDKDLTIVFGYAGSLSTTGQWKIVNWLIENRFIDIIVSTGANISEDIVEAMGKNYWKGEIHPNDIKLFKKEINRYYDVYGYEPDYGDMTDLIVDFIKTLDPDYIYSSREFLLLFGKWLQKRNVNSIVAMAAKYKVPVFSPALVDSAYGEAVLLAKNDGFNVVIDQVKDFKEFTKIGEKIKKTGVIYIGGGGPKDFIQLMAVSSPLQYSERKIPKRKDESIRGKDPYSYYPHQYAIQITTDAPQWGGLSGCTFDEAISWGKESETGKNIQCYCDATIALPIVTHALEERIKTKRKIVNYFKK
ncbi:MAG: deoxyhypusine synthase [Parcubacteria group bacterium]|nr:deoxyhypusine synthase [Parcubacteria group bacterium]